MDYTEFSSILNDSLSSLINNLLVSIDNNIFVALDELVFIDSKMCDETYFTSLVTQRFNLTILCKSLLFGFLLYYAIGYLISWLTCSNFQKPASFIIKLFFSALFIHFSSYICEFLINFFDILTDIVREFGVMLFSTKLSFVVVYSKLQEVFLADVFPPFRFFSLDGFLKVFTSFGFISLLFTYSVRFIFIKILIIFSPFAFLSICLDQSKWIFKIWIKNLIGQLFVQVFVCGILLIIFSFQTTANPTITKLLYLASLACLIKANSFVREFTSGFTSDITTSISSFKSYFQ